jgi:hypothetical protein
MKSPVFAALLAVFAASLLSAAEPAKISGRVVESMNAAGYTYFLVEGGGRKVWVAATELAVKPGDQVALSDGMEMKNYHSRTLDRTFDVVYFTGGVTVNGKPGTSAAAAAPAVGRTGPKVNLANIARAPGGQTVAEIHAGAAQLSGKPVAIRGRVVKYNGGILGKNWLHLRDGTGAEGSNDLTVTTDTRAKVGDLVLVQGTLSTNRDFGGGYKYALIVENARVVVE